MDRSDSYTWREELVYDFADVILITGTPELIITPYEDMITVLCPSGVSSVNCVKMVSVDTNHKLIETLSFP